MQKRKERAFIEHKEIIQCLWYVGKGLMYRKHLIKYFTIHGYREKVVVDAIRDLIDSKLVKSDRVGNSHVLILRKYCIYTLQGKEPDQVDSVVRTDRKTLRSAFLQARILNVFALNIAGSPARIAAGFKGSLGEIRTSWSHVSFEKRSYVVLENLRKVDEGNRESLRFLNDIAQREVDDLRIVRVHAEKKKRKEEARAIRSRKDIGLSSDAINLNGMHSRDIYFYFSRSRGRSYLNLDLLDLTSNMTQGKLEEKLKLAIPYMSHLIDGDVKIRVNVLVASETRHSYFDSKIAKIAQNVNRAIRINDVSMNVVNLDLQETLFSGMTLIS